MLIKSVSGSLAKDLLLHLWAKLYLDTLQRQQCFIDRIYEVNVSGENISYYIASHLGKQSDRWILKWSCLLVMDLTFCVANESIMNNILIF